MRRSVWIAVLVTMFVLVAPGLPRLSVDWSRFDGVALVWEQATTPAWSFLEHVVAQAGPGRELPAWGVLVLATWLLLTALLNLTWRLFNHGTVGIRRSAARGRPVARIARRHGLAQDAVRFLLDLEEEVSFPATRGGKKFRTA